MHITIIAAGKMASRCPEALLMQEYSKRLPWKIEYKEFEPKNGSMASAVEEEKLLKSLKHPADYIILLELTGKVMDSIQFAGTIKRLQEEGKRHIVFFIGASNGHSEWIKKTAHLHLSLGTMTWPHLLARVMIIEQLYRAYTIIIDHPYHK